MRTAFLEYDSILYASLQIPNFCSRKLQVPGCLRIAQSWQAIAIKTEHCTLGPVVSTSTFLLKMRPDVGHIAHFHRPANNTHTPNGETTAGKRQVSGINSQFSCAEVKRPKISAEINIS